MKKCLLIFLLLLTKTTFSQLQDDFTDANLTNNPIWKGDSSLFEVNSVLQLQTKASSIAQTVHLVTANSFATNAKWEFYLKLLFDPSANNQARIYLISDQEDLKGPLNGYFIQIGEAGSQDSYDLYKQTGTTITRIIDGAAKNRPVAGQLAARVRVTRDSAGKWELFTDISGGSDYTLEGTSNDLTHTKSSWAGVRCAYTVTNSDRFYFDDFEISRLVEDLTPPILLRVRALDSVTVAVTFDEPVDSISAKNLLNYSLTPAVGLISSSTTSEPEVYLLKLSENLTSVEYLLVVDNIRDLSGNTNSNNAGSFVYRKPYEVEKNDVVINEIFADPSPQIDLPSVEFVELWNTTNEVISLKNWRFSDGTTTYSFSTDSIRGGEFLILCAKADTGEFRKFGRVIGVSPWPSLNNAGDHLTLLDDKGVIISEVSYTDSWYRNLEKKSGGWSLERLDPRSKCSAITAWMASQSTSGGSPGAMNSVYTEAIDSLKWKIDTITILTDTTVTLFLNKAVDPSKLAESLVISPQVGTNIGLMVDVSLRQIKLTFDQKLSPGVDYVTTLTIADCEGNANALTGSFKVPPLPPLPPARIDTARILITEILADPSPEVALPLAEFVEIFNPGRDSIDLSGWLISDSTTKATLKKAVIHPGEYLILCPAADTAQFQGLGRSVGISPWPSLNNSGETIRLRSFSNRTVDSVAYSDVWYKDAVKKLGGWTLERINPLATCNGVTAWTASIHPKGGTPGLLNSVDNAGHEGLSLKADSVRRVTDSTVVVYFNKPVDPVALKMASLTLSPESGSIRPTLDVTLTQLKLQFSKKFVAGTNYSFSATLTICPAASSTVQASFSIPQIPPPPAEKIDTAKILITEIFADPSPEVGLPLAEYVELYNPGRDTIELNGWSLNDSGSKGTIKKGRILPGSFVILSPMADTSYYQPFGATIGLSPWPALNNTSERVTLKSFSGRLVDSVAYDDSWYKDSVKRLGGWSLELVDPLALCGGKQNWTASKDLRGGTPGHQNSVFRTPTAPPALELLAVVLLDSVTVKMRFNQHPDSLSAANLDNYSLNNGIGKPIKVSIEEHDEIKLVFSHPIARGNRYRLTVTGVTNCAGATIAPASNAAEFFYPKKIEKGDILVNEVLFNPRPGGVDFVEIYNISDHELDLKELSLATSKGDSVSTVKPVSVSARFLKPHHYLLITTDPDNIVKEYPSANRTAFIKIPSMPPFNDDEGTVVLASEGRQIDKLNYSEKMHFRLIKDPEGVSLERSSFTRATNETGNFRSAAASIGFATPGYRNSQQSEDVSSPDEVTLLSQTFSPDNDGFEDLLELKYRLNEPGWVANVSIFTDRGILIRKIAHNMTLSTEGMFMWDGLNQSNQKAAVGIYILRVEFFSASGQVKTYRRSFALAAKLD